MKYFLVILSLQLIQDGQLSFSGERMHSVLVNSMSLTIRNLVPKRPFCYFNFISVPKPQKSGNETFDGQAARHTESKISLKSGS